MRFRCFVNMQRMPAASLNGQAGHRTRQVLAFPPHPPWTPRGVSYGGWAPVWEASGPAHGPLASGGYLHQVYVQAVTGQVSDSRDIKNTEARPWISDKKRNAHCFDKALESFRLGQPR